MARPVAYRGSDPYAFVAYSHSDEKRIHEELDWINRQGFNAYYDDGIHPGRRWRDEIATAIDGASVFIFFITPRSVASEDCFRELNYAIDQERPVLAVHLEETQLPSGVKLSINDRQAILAYAMSPADYRLRFLDALGAYLAPDIASPPRIDQPDQKPKRPRWLLIYLPVPVLLLTLAALIVNGRWWDPFENWSRVAQDLSRADALELLREAEDLVSNDRYAEAFYVIRRINETLGNHPGVQRLIEETTGMIRPRIREREARVFFRPRQLGVELEWLEAGTTPLAEFPAPFGVVELRVEKTGYQTGHYMVANPGPLLGNHFPFNGDGPFPEIGLTPDTVVDAVQIPAATLPVVLLGTRQTVAGGDPIDLPSFEIDQREVTNREYKDFVDAGGYQNPTFWEGLTFTDARPFVLDEHLTALTDTTGRNAPAGWELGNYPHGTGNHPVGGISWFEAMAYARYRGKSLPTAHHWARAAQGPQEPAYATVQLVAYLGNFNTGSARPASQTALGPWGTYDMAGNMREWVQNATRTGRASLGGSFNDYESNYFQIYSMRPLDRHPDNGLRLMRQTDPADPNLAAPITLLTDTPRPFREPVSDAYFEGMRVQFVPPTAAPANVRHTVLEDSEDRQIEEVILEYPDREPLTLYLALPKPIPGALQSIIYMPHGGAFGDTPDRLATEHFEYDLDFIVRSGRAAIVPIWDGSRTRYRPRTIAGEIQAARSWYDDASRTITFLQRDGRFDPEKLAYLGFSFGALFGPVILAVEDRIITGILISGGIYNMGDVHPSLDITNYAPRIRQPVLLVNGRHDPLVPYGPSQQRLLDLLPNSSNKQILFDDLGHYGFPRHRFYGTVTDWLDEQLGPVR